MNINKRTFSDQESQPQMTDGYFKSYTSERKVMISGKELT